MKAICHRQAVAATMRAALIGAVLLAAGLTPGLAGAAAASRATASTDTLASCSWERPGHDPFMGDVVAAVDRYQDIPADARARLQARMAKREYDDIVSIRRDSITGRAKYGSTIRDMHFGTRRVCRSVTRASWSADMQERGLVYCESGQCILVPTVCRNVSRIARSAVAPEHAQGPEEPDAPDAGAPGGAAWADALPEAVPPAIALDAAPSFAAPDDGGAPPLAGFGPYAYGSGPGGLYPGAPSAFSASARPFGSGSTGTTSAPLTGSNPEGGPGAPPLVGIDTHGIAGAPPPVPEPQTWAAMLLGLAALAWLRGRAQGRRRSGAR